MNIPTALEPMIKEVLTLFYADPSGTREMLQDALSRHREDDKPAPPPPEGHHRFVVENEYLASDYFLLRGRQIKVPTGKVLGPWPDADIVSLENETGKRPYNHGRNPSYHTVIKRVA